MSSTLNELFPLLTPAKTKTKTASEKKGALCAAVRRVIDQTTISNDVLELVLDYAVWDVKTLRVGDYVQAGIRKRTKHLRAAIIQF